MSDAWVLGAKHNRNTVGGDKLWDRLARRQARGEVEFVLPATAERTTRPVRQTLYREQVSLPARKGAPAVPVPVRLAREEHPPAGEKAMEGRLLTQRGAETLEHVVELLEWYRRRWLEEIF